MHITAKMFALQRLTPFNELRHGELALIAEVTRERTNSALARLPGLQAPRSALATTIIASMFSRTVPMLRLCALGALALTALEDDCIGIAMTNAGPEMAPWGAASGVVGTNPWGIAAQTGGDFPISLDIALTTAGKGMMRWFEREGKKMPLDWAMTPEGEYTDDPAAAMTGALLGIGQYKGYGLAMITDVLTGVIGGGGFGLIPYSDPLRLDVSHTFIALDIAWFMPVEEFKTRMDDFIKQIKAAKPRPGVEEILVPGEVEYRREQAFRKDGALLDEEVFNRLQAMASDLGIAFPFEREVA
jgi:LDH2 family malate/lactate/ureidoglycolate dehydrogenase